MTSQETIHRLLERERKARKHAESLLETKSTELYEAKIAIEKRNEELEATLKKLKDTQSSLVQAEKMASIGRLAAAVAHQINTPVGYMQSNLESLQSFVGIQNTFFELTKCLLTDAGIQDFQSQRFRQLFVDEDAEFLIEDAHEMLQTCLQGSQRIAKITSSLLNLTSVTEQTKATFNLYEYLSQLIDKFSQSYHPAYTFKLITNKQPIIQCQEDVFSNALLELLNNAIYACKNSEKKEIHCVIDTSETSVTISVIDSGCGIHDSVRSQLFEPFVTTATTEDQLGLGLCLVEACAQSHQGNISVEESEGKTRFSMTIPK